MAPTNLAHTRARQKGAATEPSEALLGLVRALARAAAIEDYEQQHPSETDDTNESGDLRSI